MDIGDNPSKPSRSSRPGEEVIQIAIRLGMLALLIHWSFILLGLLCGYAFAWVGHFGFEKNKPASFKRPLYSFMGDWVMYKDIWTGKIPL